jgi:hypothetical protein
VADSDLVTWLRSQLDEDERGAREADAGFWYMDGHSPAVAEHIARWFPTRVLAEVEAKRRILDRYDDCRVRLEDPDYSVVEAAEQLREYEDFVLPALALPYADRPGYREGEWARG